MKFNYLFPVVSGNIMVNLTILAIPTQIFLFNERFYSLLYKLRVWLESVLELTHKLSNKLIVMNGFPGLADPHAACINHVAPINHQGPIQAIQIHALVLFAVAVGV